MCGIAGIHVFNPETAPKYIKIENAVDNLLSAIDHRGGDATGFVAIGEDGNAIWQKASCNAYDFYKERRNVPVRVRGILLHTRMATQGSAAFPENNHPVRRGSVYVVHNGHIWNDDAVFKKTGRKRYGQVDSEAIAAVISKHGILQTHKAMEEVAGAAAIGVLDENKPGLMVLARGASSPLMLYRNESIAVFASTKDAVKRAWTTLYGTAPKDNKIMEVAEGTALYLTNDEILTERFMPDDYYYNRPRVVSSGYTGHDPNQSWSNGQYGGYYTVNNQKAWSDGWDDPEDEDNFPPITFVGTNGDILCQHGCVDHDCEICNPDDELGSFLPVKYTGDNSPLISDGPGKWVSADQCELCDLWFSEKELTKVNDWGDNWKFCMTCLEEILEIEKEPSSYPMRIHGETIDEDAAITWLTDHHHDYIV